MTLRERMLYEVGVVYDGARNGFQKFKTDIASADGAIGKFKVAGTAAMSQVKAHAAELAMAGGAALVTFGVKSVQAFTDGALAAGKFATASGLSTEEASRWVAVADDVGVSGEAMSGAFLKMERAIASGKGAWTEYGIEVARGADGQVDATATMLNAIDAVGRIEDPLKRAEVAQSLWGRGFAEVSEIVLGNAGEIEKALGDVSEAQIFDEDEVRKARELRAALDELKDSLGDVSLAVGEVLTPAVTNAAEDLTFLIEKGKQLKDVADALPGPLGAVADKLDEVAIAASTGPLAIRDLTDATVELATRKRELDEVLSSESVDGMREKFIAARGQLSNFFGGLQETGVAAVGFGESVELSASQLREQADAAGEAFDGINQLAGEYERMLGTLEDEAAWLSLEEHLQQVASNADASKADLNSLKQEVVRYGAEIAAIPPETLTEINALIDQGALAEAQRLLDSLTVTRTAYVDTVVRNVGTPGNRRRPAMGPTIDGALAHGGPTRAGGLYEVTEGGKSEVLEENGKRYLMAGSDGRVTPIDGSGSGAGGSGGVPPVVVHINVTGELIDSRTIDKLVNQAGPRFTRLVAEEVAKQRRFNGPDSI